MSLEERCSNRIAPYQDPDSIVFVESNTTGTGAELIRRAVRKLGPTLFLSRDPKRYPFLNHSGAEVLLADTMNPNDMAQTLRRRNVRAVCTTSDPFTGVTAALARKLTLLGPDPAACNRCLDKNVQSQVLAQSGLKVPATFQLSRFEETSKTVCGQGPWIVKPVRGSGSVNVHVCQSKLEIEAIISAESGIDWSEWLVQSFIPGPEYSVELALNEYGSICFGVVQKLIGSLPTRVETGHIFPPNISSALQENLIRTAEQAVRALGFDFGFVHVELIDGENGLHVIEVNPRMAGGGIPFMLSAATGRDILNDWLTFHCTGCLPMGRTIKPRTCAAIAFRLADRDGTIDEIVPPLVRPSNIIRFDMLRCVGEHIQRGGDFRDRLMSATAVGTSTSEALRAAQDYVGKHKVRISSKTTQTLMD